MSVVYFITNEYDITVIPIPEIRAIRADMEGIKIFLLTLPSKELVVGPSTRSKQGDAWNESKKIKDQMMDDLTNFHIEQDITWILDELNTVWKADVWRRIEGAPPGRGVWAK